MELEDKGNYEHVHFAGQLGSLHHIVGHHPHHFDASEHSDTTMIVPFPTIGQMVAEDEFRSPADGELEYEEEEEEILRSDVSNPSLDAADVTSDYLEHFPTEHAPKKRKNGDQQLNTCLALGCERLIKQRRLCPMHQKQKERSGGRLDLKENINLNKGRSPTPFSRHANKYAKLKTFDKKIDEWAGGRMEGTLMLEAYTESSYHHARFPRHEDAKTYEHVGRNIIEYLKTLPDKHPLRKPILKAMGSTIHPQRLREVGLSFDVNSTHGPELLPETSTIEENKPAEEESDGEPENDNLLLTIKYKSNGVRNRKRDELNEESLAHHLTVDDMVNFAGASGLGTAVPLSVMPSLS